MGPLRRIAQTTTHHPTPGNPLGVFSCPQEATMAEKKIDVPELDDDQEICEGIPAEEDDR